jgi:hypothetical protein
MESSSKMLSLVASVALFGVSPRVGLSREQQQPSSGAVTAGPGSGSTTAAQDISGTAQGALAPSSVTRGKTKTAVGRSEAAGSGTPDTADTGATTAPNTPTGTGGMTTGREGAATDSDAANTQTAGAKRARQAHPGSSAMRASQKTIPFLVGRYEHAYYLLDAGPPDRVRFFAARFRLPLGPDSGDDLKGDGAYRLFDRKAEEAERAAAANQFSIAPRGVINEEDIDLQTEWLLLGTFCPSCDERHWIAAGYDANTKTVRAYSNSRVKRPINETRERGWVRRNQYRAVAIPPRPGGPRRVFLAVPAGLPLEIVPSWSAPIDDGGWFLEKYANTAGGPCEIALQIGLGRPSSDDQIQLGIGRQNGGISFAFHLASSWVSLIGDYTEKPIASSAHPLPKDVFEEQLYYYAVVIAPGVQRPGEADAARFGAELVTVRGMTLNYKARVRRQRLASGKHLLIGVYNASRSENQWLSVTLAPGRPLFVANQNGIGVTPIDGTYEIMTGGLSVKMRLSPADDNPNDVEYLIFAPD